MLDSSLTNPTLIFVTALRNALIAHGIDVRGPAVDIDDIDDLAGAPSTRPAVPLIAYQIDTLKELRPERR